MFHGPPARSFNESHPQPGDKSVQHGQADGEATTDGHEPCEGPLSRNLDSKRLGQGTESEGKDMDRMLCHVFVC